jgi:hypothetical protein
MKRESHVQFCERPGVQFLRPTHLLHFGLETAGGLIEVVIGLAMVWAPF